MKREEILKKAQECVCKNREEEYGSPEDNFKKIADLWNVYFEGISFEKFTSKDVAVMMALLKIARIASDNFKEDNWVDLAGYAACGGEIESNMCKTQSKVANDKEKYASCDECMMRSVYCTKPITSDCKWAIPEVEEYFIERCEL